MNFLGYAHWFMSIILSQMKDHSVSVDQARYATSVVSKYLDTAPVKASKKFYKTTFPSDIILTKSNSSTNDEQVEKLTMELNINYRYCIVSLIYLPSTTVDLIFQYTSYQSFHKTLVKYTLKVWYIY